MSSERIRVLASPKRLTNGKNIEAEIDQAAYRTRIRLESMLKVVEAHEGKALGEVATKTVPQPLCRSVDLDWICDKSGGAISKTSRTHLYEVQIDICGACQLKHDCLEGAIQRKEEYGIWGAKMPKERTAIRKRRGSYSGGR
jgi:Transcription factor WhiB